MYHTDDCYTTFAEQRRVGSGKVSLGKQETWRQNQSTGLRIYLCFVLMCHTYGISSELIYPTTPEEKVSSHSSTIHLFWMLIFHLEQKIKNKWGVFFKCFYLKMDSTVTYWYLVISL